MLTVPFLAQLNFGIICPYNVFLGPMIEMALIPELTDNFYL